MPGNAVHLAEDFGRGSRDVSSKRRSSLRFLVDVPAPNAFVGGVPPVSTSPIVFPALGSAHPIDPSYGIADSYDINPVPESPTTHCYIDVLYSNNRSYRLNPRPDRTAPNFKTWEASIIEVEVEIPYVFGKGIVMPTDPQSLAGYNFDIVPVKLTETRAKITRTVVLQQFNLDTLNLIRAQHNTIHKINGKCYRCEVAGNVTQTEDDPGEFGTWETQYSWHDDSGTADPGVGFGAGTLVFGQSQISTMLSVGIKNRLWVPPKFINPLVNHVPLFSDPNLYMRPPFCRLEVVFEDGATPIDDKPKWMVVMPYRIEHDGWQSLPGLTL